VAQIFREKNLLISTFFDIIKTNFLAGWHLYISSRLLDRNFHPANAHNSLYLVERRYVSRSYVKDVSDNGRQEFFHWDIWWANCGSICVAFC
jgi:hypothetical protein